MNERNDGRPDEGSGETPAIHRYITCEKCGKRMLVEISAGAREHRCPVCQAMFTTIFENGHLTTVFTA